MKQPDLEKFDEQWAAMQMDEKKRRRNKVIDDTTPKPLKLRDGKIEMVSKPSDNGITHLEINPQLRKPLRPRMAIGAIANRPDPLALEEMATRSKSMGVPEAGEGAQGRLVPLHVPSPAMVPPLNIPSEKQLATA